MKSLFASPEEEKVTVSKEPVVSEEVVVGKRRKEEK